MKTRCATLILTLFTTAQAPPADALSRCGHVDVPDLTVSLYAPSKVRIGEKIPLRISFERKPRLNREASDYFVDTHEGNFELIVEHENSKNVFRGPSFVRLESDLRFLHVPLRASTRFEMDFPVPLNDPENVFGGGGWLQDDGIYSIRARYSPANPCDSGTQGPFWIGDVESAPLEVLLLPAREETIITQRKALKECVETEDCDTLRVITFFYMVRDAKAADLLVELLRKNPLAQHVARVIFFQGRVKDAEVLREIARTSEFPENAEWLEKLAQRLEAGAQ